MPLDGRYGPGQLEAQFESREREWRNAIPHRLRVIGRYPVSALDETNTRRFLPTYLAKCAPPRDVTDPMTIARMVHCVSHQAALNAPAPRPRAYPLHARAALRAVGTCTR